jgi:hypothetical protein
MGMAFYLAGWWWWPWLILVLFSGRHIAYIGETSSRYFRDRQHLEGSTKYGAKGKPWADLDPKVYPVPIFLPHWRWLRKSFEWLLIKLLCPVYNTLLQPKYNLRRIRPAQAEAQRAARDALGMKVNIGRAIGRWAMTAVLLGGAGWLAMKGLAA